MFANAVKEQKKAGREGGVVGQAPQEAFSEEGTFELRFRMKVERMGPGAGRGAGVQGPGGQGRSVTEEAGVAGVRCAPRCSP